MKLKGISIFEQHIEKAVLAVFVLVAAGLFVSQFLNSTEIEVDREAYPPEQLGDAIRNKANSVRSSLQGTFTDADGLPGVRGLDAIGDGPSRADFQGLFAGMKIYDETKTTEVGPDTGPDITPGETGLKYAEHSVPAPAQAVAVAEAATIDPLVPRRYPDAASLLPAQQPMDERYVSVQTTFGAEKFIEMLGAIPEDPELNPIRRSWWEQSVELVDVIWERERLMENGEWGERTPLEPLPGRDTLRSLLTTSDPTPAQLPDIRAREIERRAQIRRPQMYPIIAGPQWVTPVTYRNVNGLVEVMVENGDEEETDVECERLKTRITNTTREIEKLRASIERIRERLGRGGGAGGRRGTTDGPPTRGPANGGRQGALPHSPGDLLDGVWPTIPDTWLGQVGSRRGGDEDDDRDAEERQRERDEKRIADLQERITRLEEQIARYCTDLEEQCGMTCGELLDPIEQQEEVFVDPALQEAMNSLSATEGDITLWTHDLTVEPGETYRYSARVVVINPFFGHANELDEDQRDLAASATIQSEPSDWSDPVNILPETYIRVVNASDASRPVAGVNNARRRSASAKLDVYHFYYGYWRVAQVEINAGDRVFADIDVPRYPSFTIEGTTEAPTVSGEEMLDNEVSVTSDLVMSGVFNAASRGASDVLFSTITGQTRIASRTEDFLSRLVLESQAASEDAMVLRPGSARPNSQPGGTRPGGIQPRGTRPGGPVDRNPGGIRDRGLPDRSLPNRTLPSGG